MKVFKLLNLGVLLCLLSACGVGEFFIKRTVNNFEKDVASEFKDYADFTDKQEQQIDALAREIDFWMRTDRLPLVQDKLILIASDVESYSRIQEETWQAIIEFLEQPINLSEQRGLVESLASMVHGMSDEQAGDTLKKMNKEYAEQLSDQKKQSFEKQNKQITKSLKVLFSEMDISRSRAQLKQARAMLGQRRYHERENELQRQINYEKFKQLISDRSAPKEQYIVNFLAAWRTAEAGAKHRAPEKWEHNSQVALNAINYLLADLDQQERLQAAKKIRAYAELFAKLSAS